jgi:glycosyltransferase involved in cell wall biosynthesis
VALGGRDVRSGPVAAPRLRPITRTDEEVRAELGIGARPLVLSVGRLHPQKGYGVLVSAAARWRGLIPAPVVAIAGTGPAYRELAAQISEARAPVHLLGHRTDVADLLGAADIAVVSSVWEARQLFAQEALQAGVPLVATDVGGIPDLVGDAAVLVPAGDVDALDAAVRALLADPARQAELARSGRERAALWPTEADTVTQVALIYVELRRRTAQIAAAQSRTPHVAPDPGGAG